MARLTKTLIAGSVLIAMSVSASQANADTWGHIQKLALDIQIKSDLLMGETRHYVHTPGYQRMIRCVAEMRRRAVRVHLLSIQHGCLDEMSRELRRLDALYHEVEGIFDSAECRAAVGVGHVHGSTRHVKKLLKVIEDCIHHIRADIATLRRPAYPRNPYAAAKKARGYGAYNAGSWSHKNGYGSFDYGQRSYKRGYQPHPRSKMYQRDCYEGVCPSDRFGLSYSNDHFSLRLGF